MPLIICPQSFRTINQAQQSDLHALVDQISPDGKNTAWSGSASIATDAAILNDRQAKRIAELEKQREELLVAIKDAYHVMTTDPAFPYSYHVVARELGNVIRKAEAEGET